LASESYKASGIAIADALADPKAPAGFTDMIAFAQYLSSLRNAEEAASWQQWLNTVRKAGRMPAQRRRLHHARLRDVGLEKRRRN
jgi:hypothetical protein